MVDRFNCTAVIERMRSKRDAVWEPGDDSGFTLIELMVVLLILAILLAIAIPTFLGTTQTANDRGAQSDLNTALTTVKTLATQNGQAYGGGSNPISGSLLSTDEPSLSWANGVTTTPGQISWYVDTGNQGIVLATPAKGDSICWYAVDNLTFVTGGGANGPYTDTTAKPGITGSATSAPTAAGTFYSQAPEPTAGCDATSAVSNFGTWSTTAP